MRGSLIIIMNIIMLIADVILGFENYINEKYDMAALFFFAAGFIAGVTAALIIIYKPEKV